MQFFVEAMGIRQVETRFERMGAAAVSAEPAMELVLKDLYRIFDATFQSEGRRGGGSWAQDTDAWLKRKIGMGLDPRIGHATLALRDSMSKPDDPNQEVEISANFVRLASTLPYAATEQRHRPFVKLTRTDRERLRLIIRDYLAAAWKGAV